MEPHIGYIHQLLLLFQTGPEWQCNDEQIYNYEELITQVIIYYIENLMERHNKICDIPKNKNNTKNIQLFNGM